MYDKLKGVFDGIEPDSPELHNIDMSDIEGIIPAPLTIPSKIAFPQTVKDVVEVVKFSKEWGLKVSVKNSGHNYAGQSDVEGSFQLNLRNFPKFSKTDVVVCSSETATQPLDGPPCQLALARGNGAVVRVSGNEGNDSIYSSVHNWNHQQPREKRFQVSGGGEGAVGAGGGYMMGGSLGMGVNDRKWGICIDQVLELEMVLASGEHVKFGPAEWEHDDNFLYPQTTVVKGLCNKNVHHLESEWVWEECETDIPFADLWFAVRGGGGGTWGVVISSWQQLHDEETWYIYLPNTEVSKALKADCDDQQNCADVEKTLNKIWIDFNVDFLYGDITDESGNDEAASCGANGIQAQLDAPAYFTPPSGPPGGLMSCIGEGPTEKFLLSWKNYVASHDLPKGVNVTLAQNVVAMYPLQDNPLVPGVHVMNTYGDFTLTAPATGMGLMDRADKPNPLTKAPLSSAFSAKSAALYSSYGYNLLIPVSLLLEKSELTYEILRGATESHYFGANSAISSDGMDSMSWAFRKAALGLQWKRDDETLEMVQAAVVEHLLRDPEYVEGEFPGFQELNHVEGNSALPLAGDWSKICPREYTAQERREKCMSVQETVWGTRNLERLEAIKESVDPDGVFAVARYGVGNDWVMGWHEKGIAEADGSGSDGTYLSEQ